MSKQAKYKKLSSLRNLKGKTVLLRASLNVPIEGGVVQDDFRIRSVVPTLQFLKDKGAKTIILSHLGKDGSQSLRDVARFINNRYIRTGFLPNSKISKNKHLIEKMNNGGIFVLENIRMNEGEEQNSKAFAKELAEYADIYVNDDFAVSHREHASVSAITEFLPSYAGFQFDKEISKLSMVFKPEKPFVLILGGAKFETKLPLVNQFIKKANKIFIVGALANSFLKEMGYEVGRSLVDDKKLGLKKLAENKKIVIPTDVVVRSSQNNVETKNIKDVRKGDTIFDNGHETVELIKKDVAKAKMVLWNGPLGKFEEGFMEATEEVARAIAKSKAYSVVGGGDSIAAIKKLKLEKKFSFVSTGGGAMLDYLADKTIPGLSALLKNKIELKS